MSPEAIEGRWLVLLDMMTDEDGTVLTLRGGQVWRGRGADPVGTYVADGEELRVDITDAGDSRSEPSVLDLPEAVGDDRQAELIAREPVDLDNFGGTWTYVDRAEGFGDDQHFQRGLLVPAVHVAHRDPPRFGGHCG